MPTVADRDFIDALTATGAGDARLCCIVLNAAERDGQRELAVWTVAALARNERYTVVICDACETSMGPAGFDPMLVKGVLADAAHILLWGRNLEESDVLPLLTELRATQRGAVVMTRPTEYASWRRLIGEYAPRSARVVELTAPPVSAAGVLLGVS